MTISETHKDELVEQLRVLRARVAELECERDEHRRAEAALSDIEAGSRAIVKAAIDTIITIDEEGLIQSINSITEKMFGYFRDEMIGRSIAMLLPEPYCQGHDSYLQNPLATGQKGIVGFGRETTGRRKDGTTFPIALSVTEAQVRGRRVFIGIIRDISRHKHTEGALRDIAEGVSAVAGTDFFRFLVRHMTDTLGAEYALVAELSPDESNRSRVTAIHGRSRTPDKFEYDWKNTPCEDVLANRLCIYPDHVQQRFPKASLLKELNIESYAGVPLVRADGDVIGLIAVLDSEPMRNPELTTSMLRIFAVRASAELERKRAEEALREKERRYALATAAARVGVWDWDLQSNRLYLDANLKGLLGYDDHEIPNTLEAWTDHIHPDDRQAVMEAAAAHIEGRTTEYILEHRMIHKDRSIRWFLARGAVIRDASGKAVRMVGTDVDITERKRVEEENARFSRVLDSSLNELYFFDAETLHFLEVNHGARKNLGYSMEELRDLTPMDLKPEFTAESFTELVEPLRAGVEEKIQFTTVHRRKDSSLYPVEVHLQLMGGNDPIFLAIMLDITERKRAEEELRDAELRTRTLLEGSSACNKIIDLDSRLQYMSAAGVKQLKIADISLFYGCTYPPEFFPESMRAPLIEHLERAKAGEMTSVECPVLDTEGCELWYHSTFVPARDDKGRIQYIIVTSVDITKRVRAERALKLARDRLEIRVKQRTVDLAETNRRLETEIAERRRAEEALRPTQFAVDHAMDAIFWIDPQGRFFSVNDSACSRLGYSRDELLTMSVADVDPTYQVERWSEAFQRFQETGSTTIEAIHRTKQGKEFPVEITVNPLEFGGRSFICAFARDITERKQAELKAKQHQAELAHVARLSTMGEMASGIAHELNQPLCAIATYGHACQRLIQDGALDLAELAVASEEMAKQAMRAGEIIRRMRKFVRKHEPRGATVNINDLIREAVALAESDTKELGVELRFRLADRLQCVTADPIQIEQVILNLIRNSLDAMQECPMDMRKLTVSSAMAGQDRVEIAVQDTGPRVPSGVLNQVFDPFFTTKREGMGLGLSISRSIIEAYGGSLEAASTKQGTTFRFSLPSSLRVMSVTSCDVAKS